VNADKTGGDAGETGKGTEGCPGGSGREGKSFRVVYENFPDVQVDEKKKKAAEAEA
jgi:hypothetical protein